MTFFEYMKQQTERDDFIGDLAKDMVTDEKLADDNLQEMNLSQWRKRIKEKSNNDRSVIAALNAAAKEWENEKITKNITK